MTRARTILASRSPGQPCLSRFALAPTIARLLATMNPTTFLTVSLVILAPAAAFFLDHQIYYQQSMEDLSAEQNAVEDRSRRRSLSTASTIAKRDETHSHQPPRHSSYEDSSELMAEVSSSEIVALQEPESDSEESDAIWHHPCGVRLSPRPHNPEASRRTTGRRLLKSLHTVWRQLNVTSQQYKTQEYEQLYSRIHKGVEERQYVPTWIPDRGDAVALSEMNVNSREHLGLALSMLHTGLQKFAVALEQIIVDEEDQLERGRALRATQSTLRTLLCEVEIAMTTHGWSAPPRVPRSIMIPAERRAPDFTRRLLRDWGVLLRYGTFLRAWTSMMNTLYSAVISLHSMNRDNLWPRAVQGS